MTFKAYLSDQKWLIVMFVFMMIFVSTTILDDPYIVLEESNIAPFYRMYTYFPSVFNDFFLRKEKSA